VKEGDRAAEHPSVHLTWDDIHREKKAVSNRGDATLEAASCPRVEVATRETGVPCAPLAERRRAREGAEVRNHASLSWGRQIDEEVAADSGPKK